MGLSFDDQLVIRRLDACYKVPWDTFKSDVLTDVDQTVVHIGTAPANPKSGDLWWEDTGGVARMKMYNGTAWQIIISQEHAPAVLVGPSEPIGVKEGTLWHNTTNRKLMLFREGTTTNRVFTNTIASSTNSSQITFADRSGFSELSVGYRMYGETSGGYTEQIVDIHPALPLLTFGNPPMSTGIMYGERLYHDKAVVNLSWYPVVDPYILDIESLQDHNLLP